MSRDVSKMSSRCPGMPLGGAGTRIGKPIPSHPGCVASLPLGSAHQPCRRRSRRERPAAGWSKQDGWERDIDDLRARGLVTEQGCEGEPRCPRACNRRRFAHQPDRLPQAHSARDIPAEHGCSAPCPCAKRPDMGRPRCPPPGAGVRERARLPPRSTGVVVPTDAKLTRSVPVKATGPQTALLISHGMAAMRPARMDHPCWSSGSAFSTLAGARSPWRKSDATART